MTIQPTTAAHGPAPTSPADTTIEWTAASRRPRQLWRLAGFDDRSQPLWFVTYAIRPPLVSSSAVPVVAQLTEPLSAPRRALTVGALLIAGATTGAILPSRPVAAAAMIVVLLIAAASVATRALHGGVDADHLRLHDIVASERHSGDGELALRSLLASVDRGVELDVETGRPGLVALYSRLGFTVSESTPVPPGLIRMTRPAAASTTTADPHEGRS